MTTTAALSHAEQNAAAHLELITTAHEAWQFCQDDTQQGRELSREARALLHEHEYDGTNHEEVGESIADEAKEQALSVAVRSGWDNPGELSAAEFQILLSTGGPALRMIGQLNDWSEPDSARLEYQDWGTPWTEWAPGADEDALLWFASLFWFGDS